MPNISCPNCGHTLTPTELDAARFDSYVRKEEGCWIWTGPTTTYGYGVFGASAKNHLTHRWQWERYNGPIPSGLMVLHGCDNPPCVNPDHLSIGTMADNMRDKMTRGRHRYKAHKGEAHGRALLTEVQVREIRARYTAGEGGPSLAKAYGMGRTTIYAIIKRKLWKHI